MVITSIVKSPGKPALTKAKLLDPTHDEIIADNPAGPLDLRPPMTEIKTKSARMG
jgi:hypothetical protein